MGLYIFGRPVDFLGGFVIVSNERSQLSDWSFLKVCVPLYVWTLGV